MRFSVGSVNLGFGGEGGILAKGFRGVCGLCLVELCPPRTSQNHLMWTIGIPLHSPIQRVGAPRPRELSTRCQGVRWGPGPDSWVGALTSSV